MTRMLHSPALRAAGLLAGLPLLALLALFSLRFGMTDTNWQTVYEALVAPTDSTVHLIIRTTRMPRVLIATVVGASLGVAGALTQALTRNPLAAPGIFGVNAGAAFFVVLTMTVWPVRSLAAMMAVAFLGAAVSAAVVYGLGSLGRGGLSPLQVTLAGAATAALFFTLTQGLIAGNPKAVHDALFWMAGSVAGRELAFIWPALPVLGTAWLGALALGRPITTLLMGEDVARGLGQRTGLVKAAAAAVVVLLAGVCVAVAGPISLVGLVAPHAARVLVGVDHRWVIPYAALAGAVLLLAADIGARLFVSWQEVPVGVMTALLGAPFFVYLARKGEARL